MNVIPVPKNEKSRLKALHDHQILDSLNEYEFDRITELASIICEVPISLVSLVDEHRQWFKSSVGLDTKETDRELAFCGYTIMDTSIFEVEDATKDERFKDNALVTGDPHIRFYAGYPVFDEQGYALGSLCVIDRKPRKLSAKQKRALEVLSQEISSLIAERKIKEELKDFQKLFEQSNDLVFIGGIDGYFKKVNPAFERVLGWSEEHLLNTSSFEFYHPDDVESTVKELQKLSGGGKTVNFLQRFKTASGEYKTIEWASIPELETGNIFGIGRDVSELTLKDQQLAASEGKLRAFFNNSQGLMCTHDLKGNFISLNTAGAETLGYTVDEIIKLSLFDVMPKDKHPLVNKYLDEIKQNGKVKGQMVTLHKDGSIRIWMYNNTLQTDPGSPPYVIGNGTDITERHYLEEKLKRTSQMLEQTNQVARVGGWEYNLVKKKVFWTSVTKEIHGMPPDYEPDIETSINFYKEGKSRDRIAEVIKRAMADGTPWNEELQIINNKGEEIWIRTLGNAEFENGNCVKLYGTFQDIDVYKYNEIALQGAVEAQARLNKALSKYIDLIREQDKTIEKIQEFKFLADSIPQIVWISNPDGSLDYYNQYWFDYSGMSLKDTMDYGWTPVLHPDDISKDFKPWTEMYVEGKHYEEEVRFKRISDGTYRWHLGIAVPMKDSKGNIIKWFGSFTDIDEYKRALDLENRISQFEDFNRIVAHNLRGPAATIQMILEMYADSASEPDRSDYLAMLKQASSTLIDTLNELMKVLEIRNNQNLPYDTCNFKSIVNSVEVMLKGQIIKKKAIIHTYFKIPSMAFPKMYLESIFYNMISNSLKYSRAAVPPVITIKSEFEDGKLILTFNDNGLGIDLKKHGENVFKLNNVFHNGHDSKGIGLFMTKTQIETFGGNIKIGSEPNVGTTFTITF
ncbi:PAS domain S-box-containing protein [Mucilaginibacter frigoritolerans]|uniref:histidine kinase n=1 Tax=Mucilaginibacter frigoritolerans TaxID=652788 RepID=A0A562TM22_9SPHI|nr:PAS domain S-box protein [Mucilaginibacter frigoritolerans]TWI94597.1 PAS domain S-box-containing protein [Mucilaginibacter frigoritolerans]